MKSIFEVTGKHVNKRLTVQVPRKYATGESGYDMDQVLKDHNADCLIYGDKSVLFEYCHFDFSIHNGDRLELTITDL